MEKYVLQKFCDFYHNTPKTSSNFCLICKNDLCHNHTVEVQITNQPYNRYHLCPTCFDIIFHEVGLS